MKRCDGSGVTFREAPHAVRRKALGAGAGAWLESLPALVAALERDGSISVGRPYTGGTDAFVAEATRSDGVPAFLKLRIPRADVAAVTVAALEEPKTAGHVYQLTGGKTPIKTALSKALG